ncbi:FecR family protein [Hymenobacter sp. GOD-10R]|uniref:FecR family protein n=1 Tax=Hymenobacter sp. GOD-10R TaxID=3093922 RepID=UPI002D7A24E3|nr:FecR domain-containing protein [Hymenobacter sp. GOD-10R]WRQ26368.1 FecR domain-containing protein [Hymenobacter sp. GOD-10R]
MPTPVDFEAYLRYLRRQSSPAETRAVLAWLAQPTNALVAQHWMEKYAQLLEHEQGLTQDTPDFDHMQAALLQQLGLVPNQIEAEAQKRNLPWRRWAAAAAVLVGVAAGGGWLWQTQYATPPLTQLTTPYGQTRVVRLPDGSTVTLNSHSTLRYAADLGQASVREVWLDGEAYFAVKHLPNHRRFVVRTTAGFRVEVLGTKFTVYRRHQQGRVVLLSGKVKVGFTDRTRSNDVVLKPGELVETWDAQPRQVVHKVVNTAPYAAWKDDKLVFDGTTLAEVATRLSDTYGVAVVVENPALNQRKISGTFSVGDLEALLQLLEKSFQLTVSREQNRIILSDHSSH